MKRLLSILLLAITSFQLLSCDLCGCSSGNYFLGPVPQFSKHFVGLRYSFRSYNTVLKSDDSQFSRDFYQTSELWGGLKIKNKIQLLLFIPYNINHSVTDDGAKRNQGLGDITLIGNYSLLDKKYVTRDTLSASQQLWLGAGIKLPSGSFSPDPAAPVSSANIQAGTGSLDYLFSASYLLVIDKKGLTSNLNYKINGPASGFRFGNRFSASLFAFRSFAFKRLSLSPNAGVLYENLGQNEEGSIRISDTGGYALLGALGMELKFGKITIGFNSQIPFIQNISDSQTKAGLRGMIHLTHSF